MLTHEMHRGMNNVWVAEAGGITGDCQLRLGGTIWTVQD